MLPRLAVWQVLLTDKVLSARPRSVLERIRKAVQTLCTPAGFSPRQSLGLGGFGCPAQRDRLRAKGVCWEKSAGGARAGTCAGKSPPGSQVERELAGSKPAPLCSCGCPRSTFTVPVIAVGPACSSSRTDRAELSLERVQGMKGSRTSLGSPANAPVPSSLICSQDGELAAWHNLPVVGTGSWEKPRALPVLLP